MKRKRRSKPPEDETQAARPLPALQLTKESSGLADRAGPALRLAGPVKKAPTADTDEEPAPPPALALRPPVGQETRRTVFANGQTMRLRGRTDATFDGGNSSIRNQRVARADGCENCTGGCLRVQGTLVLTYRVRTSVSLPSVADFPNLTPCQQHRIRAAIDDVLAPHEQEHVRAFETYNGTTRHPFDIRTCNAEEANAQLQAIHDSEATAREASAQALSDALDPFHFDVDLDCQDAPSQDATTPAGEGGPTDGHKVSDATRESKGEREETPS